ncbi:helix-turn-helix domain-containing protein [Flexithrix dorotheae]|uniref:helix-turn-helix domain-containing protein n=1 Tax=Flexithrix dorotheae TaxID=70993 RepID=UPI00037B5AC4|nr:AraC family transcriptional regulator [Flexithrix dorotheae]
MIKNRQHLDLNGRTVIEKLKVLPPLRQNPVFQDEACFLYFNEGGTHISAPTEKITIKQSESVLLKCGTYFADLFQSSVSGICEVCVIHFFPDILERIFKEEIPFFVKQQKPGKYTYGLSQKNVIDHFIKSLDFYFDNPELAKEEILYLKIKELILLLLHTEAAETILELYSFLFTPQKANISDVIESHLYANLSLEQMAFLAGQSLSTFKRKFKKHFNDTPANYIRNKRMKKAGDLLKHSSLTISEISFQVGYEDSSYFSRLFQQKFKILPSEYRKANQKPTIPTH